MGRVIVLLAGLAFGQYVPPGGGAFNNPSANGTNFYCSFYANPTLCLNALRTYASAAEDGTGQAGCAIFNNGVQALGSTFALASGMCIRGVAPRAQYIAGSSPDDFMVINGGTWFDCGGGQCFSGSHLTGVTLENFGMFDFTTAAASFGSSGVEGMVQSQLHNLFLLGGSSINASNVGLEIFNPANVHADIIKINNVNTGLHIVSGISAWQPGNSTFTDVYISTYPKSASNANNTFSTAGMVLEQTGVNTLALVTFIRPQITVQGGGDNTGYNLYTNGLQQSSFYDLDMEGSVTFGAYNVGAIYNRFFVSSAVNKLSFDATSFSNNVQVSNSGTNAGTTVGATQYSANSLHIQNLMVQSQALGTSPWNNLGGAALTLTNAASTAPDGSATATSVVAANTNNDYHFFGQGSTAIVPQLTYTYCVNVQLGTPNVSSHRFMIREDAATGAAAVFDISAGTLIANVAGGLGTITPLAATGWYQVGLTVASLSTNPSFNNYFMPNTGTSYANAPYAATTGDKLNFWGAHANVGVTCGPYMQKTTIAIP